MGTGIHKLIVVGAVVTALGLAAPAFGNPALPDGYQQPSAEPTGYTPQALKALGERGEAMAAYYGRTAIGSQQFANQRQLETWATVDANQRSSALDANQRQVEPFSALDANERQVEPARPPVVVAGDSGSFDWNTVGIAGGTAALLAALGLAGILGIRSRSTVAHP
jgi:hypothetical protein